MRLKLASFKHSLCTYYVILWTIVYENQTIIAPCMNRIKTLLQIDSPSIQIRISLIILLGMNDSVCHLGKLKLVGFQGFVTWMSVITPGFIGPFSKYTIGWKKLQPFLNKGPDIFFPLDPLSLVVTVLPLKFQTRV